MLRTLISIPALVFALQNPLLGQVAVDDPAVLRTTVDALRAEFFPEGSFTLDPRRIEGAADGFRLAAPRSADSANSVAAVVGAAGAVRIDENLECTGATPRGCSLRVGVAAIALSDSELQDDGTVTVRALMRYRSGSERQPVAMRGVIVVLDRKDGDWVVREIQTLVVS